MESTDCICVRAPYMNLKNALSISLYTNYFNFKGRWFFQESPPPPQLHFCINYNSKKGPNNTEAIVYIEFDN